MQNLIFFFLIGENVLKTISEHTKVRVHLHCKNDLVQGFCLQSKYVQNLVCGIGIKSIKAYVLL